MDLVVITCVMVGVAALGFILWQVLKTSAKPTPLDREDSDKDESDGVERSSRGSRTKKRPYQLRNRQKKGNEEPTPLESRQEEETQQTGGRASRSVSPPTPGSGKRSGKSSPEVKRASAKSAAESPSSRRARKVSFSDDAQSKTRSPTQEVPPPKAAAVTTAAAPPPAHKTEEAKPKPAQPAPSPKKDSPLAAVPAKAPQPTKSVAKSSPPSKPKAAKNKPPRDPGAASPTSVSELAKLIESANLSPSDAQRLVDVVLSSSSGASEWVSQGSHGRSEETLDSVKRTRDRVMAEMEDLRTAHHGTLDSMKERRAEMMEEIKQLKVKLDAMQKALMQKTQEASMNANRVRTLEGELDSQPTPVVSGDVQRAVAENGRLKAELESARVKLAESQAEVNKTKQTAKATETSLSNQLQQAKSNTEKQQRRARDLEKQLQTSTTAGAKAADTKSENDDLRQKVAALEASHAQQLAAVEKSNSEQLAALEKGKADDVAAAEKQKADALSALEKEKATQISALELKSADQAEQLAELEKSKAALVAELKSAQVAPAAVVNGEATGASGADAEAVSKLEDEITDLKKKVDMWKTDAGHLEEKLKAAVASTSKLRESTWKAKDEAAEAHKVAKAELKKSIDGFKARQHQDAEAERTEITKLLCGLHTAVEVSGNPKTLVDWVGAFVKSASVEIASASASSDASESLEEAKSDAQQWKSRCEDAENVLSQTTETLSNIQAQFEEEDLKQMGKLQALEAELKRSEALRQQSIQETEQLKKQIADAEKEHKRLQDKSKENNETLQKKQNEFQSQLEQTRAANGDLQKLLQQASSTKEKQLNEVTDKLRRAETELSSLRAQFDEAQRQVAGAEKLSSDNKSELAALTADLEKVKKEKDAAVGEKAKLESSAAESVSKCAKLEDELQAARREVDAAIDEKKKLSEDVDQMINRLSEVRTAMSKLEVEKRELAQRLETVMSASASASTDV